jgi:hypothetical protein
MKEAHQKRSVSLSAAIMSFEPGMPGIATTPSSVETKFAQMAA